MINPIPTGAMISYLKRSARIYLRNELRPYNLGSGQFPFLMALYYKDGINQEELARNHRYDKATIARAVQKLENEGYVSRQRDPADRRAFLVYLTDKGRQIMPDMKRIASGWQEEMLSGFEEDEQAAVNSFLERMVRNVSSREMKTDE